MKTTEDAARAARLRVAVIDSVVDWINVEFERLNAGGFAEGMVAEAGSGSGVGFDYVRVFDRERSERMTLECAKDFLTVLRKLDDEAGAGAAWEAFRDMFVVDDAIETMRKDLVRRPIAVATSTVGLVDTLFAVCDDGAVFGMTPNLGSPDRVRWRKLASIPGSPADLADAKTEKK